jgi:YidC/Oxa1 family membrane protein insertase
LDNYSAFLQKLNLHQSELGLNFPEKTLGPRQFLRQIYRIYLGPQELQIINRINPEWSAIIYYGTFDFIAQLLVQALEFFYRLAHNWGWAIIFLSLAIYLLLYPLTLKQLRSMKEMQALQPRMEEIRRAYKDNPQKLNSEIMKLYREHKVNPLGGCLPLILQLPVFFALYQALLRASFLRGASFLWIKDLTEPDRLFLLPANLPVHEVNILPILMAITMFIQQKLSLTAATDSVAEQQKMMLVIMPLMFGFIFYNMPAGLVLYWFVNSTLMLMNQLRLKRAK